MQKMLQKAELTKKKNILTMRVFFNYVFTPSVYFILLIYSYDLGYLHLSFAGSFCLRCLNLCYVKHFVRHVYARDTEQNMRKQPGGKQAESEEDGRLRFFEPRRKIKVNNFLFSQSFVTSACGA